jgi:hypothetical protein
VKIVKGAYNGMCVSVVSTNNVEKAYFANFLSSFTLKRVEKDMYMTQ